MLVPHAWHRIDIVDTHITHNALDGSLIETGVVSDLKKAYTWDEPSTKAVVRKDEMYWSTYRHTLEEFVNKIKDREGSDV